MLTFIIFKYSFFLIHWKKNQVLFKFSPFCATHQPRGRYSVLLVAVNIDSPRQDLNLAAFFVILLLFPYCSLTTPIPDFVLQADSRCRVLPGPQVPNCSPQPGPLVPRQAQLQVLRASRPCPSPLLSRLPSLCLSQLSVWTEIQKAKNCSRAKVAQNKQTKH